MNLTLKTYSMGGCANYDGETIYLTKIFNPIINSSKVGERVQVFVFSSISETMFELV